MKLMLKFKTLQYFWFLSVKKAHSAFFELLNSWKIDKYQICWQKWKLWGPKMLFDTSNSLLNGVKSISKFLGVLKITNCDYSQQNLR